MKSLIRTIISFLLNLLPPRLLGRLLSKAWCPSALKYYVRPGKDLPVLINSPFFQNTKLVINTIYPIEKQLLTRGHYDLPLLETLSILIKPGMTALDIGANIGSISIPIAQLVGSEGKVLSFEPGERNFERLQRNIKANPALNQIISTFKIGLSDKTQTLYWQEVEHNRGNAFFHDKEGEAMVVHSLDAFMKDNNWQKLKVDFIKIDVEGMELNVIKGAEDTIRTYLPVIIYESWTEMGNDDELCKIESILADLGYTFFTYEGNSKFKKTSFPNLTQNTVAIPSHKLNFIDS